MDTAAVFSEYSTRVLSTVSELSVLTLIALATIALLTFVALRLGKENITALIFSLYIGLFLYTWFPFFKTINEEMFYQNLAIWIVCVALSFVVIRRTLSISFDESAARSWFDAILLSVSAVGLILALLYSTFPLPVMPLITPYITELLLAQQFVFWWLVVPIVAVFITSRN